MSGLSGEFWLAVAGLGFSTGTYVLGRASGYGRKTQKLESIEKSVGELKEEVGKINTNLIGCQNNSFLNRGQLSATVENLKSEIEFLKTKADDHLGDRDVHTDREWRDGTIDRLEKIASSIGGRIGTLELNITNQLGEIRSQIKNGHNGNGGKLS